MTACSRGEDAANEGAGRHSETGGGVVKVTMDGDRRSTQGKRHALVADGIPLYLRTLIAAVLDEGGGVPPLLPDRRRRCSSARDVLRDLRMLAEDAGPGVKGKILAGPDPSVNGTASAALLQLLNVYMGGG